MDEVEQQISTDVHDSVDRHEGQRPRSQQGLIGVSELGTCRQKTLLKLLQVNESDHQLKMSAIVGDAVGERIERALIEHPPEGWKRLLRQATVTVDLPSGQFQLKGHPDLVRPDWGVLDLKSKDGLELIRSNGSDQQNRFQRHLYTLGSAQCGLLDIPVERAMTGNVYVDRSGSEEYPFVEVEQFDWAVIYEAEAWLDDVVYAAKEGEDASRDKPRQWCASFCEFFTHCRGVGDTDVTGLIEDPEQVGAVEMYAEGMELAKAGDKKKAEAKKLLKGVVGNTDKFAVREVHVGESEVPGYTRKSHTKIDIRRLK